MHLVAQQGPTLKHNFLVISCCPTVSYTYTQVVHVLKLMNNPLLMLSSSPHPYFQFMEGSDAVEQGQSEVDSARLLSWIDSRKKWWKFSKL